MDQAIQALYKDKKISADEARKYAVNKNLFPASGEVKGP
jgi:Tfp pilus assembly ATPase PilU